jgi:hypothetical protein
LKVLVELKAEEVLLWYSVVVCGWLRVMVLVSVMVEVQVVVVSISVSPSVARARAGRRTAERIAVNFILTDARRFSNVFEIGADASLSLLRSLVLGLGSTTGGIYDIVEIAV